MHHRGLPACFLSDRMVYRRRDTQQIPDDGEVGEERAEGRESRHVIHQKVVGDLPEVRERETSQVLIHACIFLHIRKSGK